MKGANDMKLYNVFVYNNLGLFTDIYMVRADDPVDARNVAVQRLIDETGDGLDVWDIVDVIEVKGVPQA
jgi:hypothetical protein